MRRSNNHDCGSYITGGPGLQCDWAALPELHSTCFARNINEWHHWNMESCHHQHRDTGNINLYIYSKLWSVRDNGEYDYHRQSANHPTL
jgi:hypothetical protein